MRYIVRAFMHKKGFDTKNYLRSQVKEIKKRTARFGKLYLEFGGKLSYDMHAMRVLPGYEPDSKVKLLKKLGDIEIISCISAKDIEKGRVRRDFGLTYDNQLLKDISDIREYGLDVSCVIITRYQGEYAAKVFLKKLENFGIKVFIHREIEGYPDNFSKVLKGYSTQPYIKTKNPLVVVTGVGGGSGKMALCLSQIFHERNSGMNVGFAKFETFPVWNLDLNHPVNLAYEAATADLFDVNMIDPFHKKAYGILSVNYNRDIENFSILKRLMQQITTEIDAFGYKSPTDMGVNTVLAGIIDEQVCINAAKQEIIRRYFRYLREKVEGIETQETICRIEGIMKKACVKPEDRRVVVAARNAAKSAKRSGKGFQNVFCGAAIELKDKRIVTGKNSSMLYAESAAILNAVKVISKIPDNVDIISPDVIKAIKKMKKDLLNRKATSLSVNEVLISLAMSSIVDKNANTALSNLSKLANCEMHVTHMPKKGDETGLIRLKLITTTDAKLSVLSEFE